MFFCDRPRFVPSQTYDRAIEQMCARLAGLPGLMCIYQIGHVSTPGISDLDLLLTFEDDTSCDLNPLYGLSRNDRHLFVHSPFVVTRSDFSEALKYTFFHNYQLRWGNPPDHKSLSLPSEEEHALKQQIALEYLVRMWVSLSVELIYGIVKLRNLFLHAKGLLYDCEFLGVSSGEFVDAVQSIVAFRANWFHERPVREHLKCAIRNLHESLQDMLSDLLAKRTIYLPHTSECHLAPHIRLVRGPRVQVVHRGTVLPSALGCLGRKYFNCQHRWNDFEFHLPFDYNSATDVIERGLALRRRMAATRDKCFPHFLTLSSSLAY